MTDDVDLDVGVGLEPSQKLIGYGEAFGVDPVLIANEVNAQDVGLQADFERTEFNVDGALSKKVWPE